MVTVSEKMEKRLIISTMHLGVYGLKNCLNKEDFKRSTIFDELAEAARGLGYETISDMLLAEYQETGSARQVACKLGFSKDPIIKYLKLIGVTLKYQPIARTDRKHAISLYRRGVSGYRVARIIDRSQRTTRRALLRDLGTVEYRNLTIKHRLNTR